MLRCKKCNSNRTTKSGMVNDKQRYFCKDCGYHFTEGDGRVNEQVVIKKALCVVMHSLGKASYRTLAKIFNTSPSLTYRWVAEYGWKQPNPQTTGTIKRMKIEELRSFIKTQEKNFKASKPLAVTTGELWPGFSAIVIMQPLDDSKTK